MVFQNTIINGYWITDNKTKVRIKDTVFNICRDSFYNGETDLIHMDNGQKFQVSEHGTFTIIN